MLYVFLDIDGVLNREADWKYMYSLNQKCIKEFARALRRCKEVRIVLTSTWRHGFAYEQECEPHIKELQQALGKYGLSIYAKTPICPLGNREDEIDKFIETYEVENYVIVDDEISLYHGISRDFFLTDSRKGFTRKDGNDLKNWLMIKGCES